MEAANAIHGDSDGGDGHACDGQRTFNVGGAISGSCRRLNRAGGNTRGGGDGGCGRAVLTVDSDDGGQAVTVSAGASRRMASVVSTSGNRCGQVVAGGDSAVASGGIRDDGGVIEIDDDPSDDDKQEHRLVYGFVADALAPVNPATGWLRCITIDVWAQHFHLVRLSELLCAHFTEPLSLPVVPCTSP